MARRPTHRPARAITAAARRLDTTKPAASELGKRPFAWQKEAFGFYDSLGEVRFAARWYADAMSRLRLVAAWEEHPGAPIQVLDDDADIEGVSDQDKEAAWAAVARLDGAQGGQSEILRELGLQTFLVGEGYLVAYMDDDNAEVWCVVSVDALAAATSRGTGFLLKPYPEARDEDCRYLGDDEFVLRVMRRHPRFAEWPDSAMRAALDYCEDLRVLTASIRATAMSRIPAGILGIPEEASFGPPDVTTDSGDGEAADDPLTRDLLEHLTTPLSDPRSASAVMPLLLRMAKDDLAAVKHWTIDRPIDQLAVQLREETRRAFAASVDLPAEVLVGRGDLNHWTAWAVTDEAWRNHIEPGATVITDALTYGYYRPALAAQGVESVGRHVLWADPTDLVSNPDQGKTALDLYDRGEISGVAVRRAAGVSEEDAPDDEELGRRERLTVILGKQGQGQQGQGGRPDAPESTGPPEVTGGAFVVDAEVVEDEPVEPVEVEVVVAAALPEGDPLAGLGLMFARMEQGLRSRLQVAADEVMTTALERAGSRVRSYAHKGGGQLRAAVQGVASSEVAATLGPKLVASLGTSPEELLADSVDRMEPKWFRWVEATQREARRLVERAALTAAGAEVGASGEEVLRHDGWAVLREAMLHAGAEAMFHPTAALTEGASVAAAAEKQLVSTGAVRRALTVAGGGPRADLSAVASTGAASSGLGGLLSGQSMSDLLHEAAQATFGQGWVWVYGDPGSRPTGPFDGHYELEGLTFRDLTDDELANTFDWPDTDYFYPGDHDGCQCERALVVEREEQPAVEVEPLPSDQFDVTSPNAPLVARDSPGEFKLSQFPKEMMNEFQRDVNALHAKLPFTKNMPQPTFGTTLTSKSTYGQCWPSGTSGWLPSGSRAERAAQSTIDLNRAMLKGDKPLWGDVMMGFHPGQGRASEVVMHEYGHAVANAAVVGIAPSQTATSWRIDFAAMSVAQRRAVTQAWANERTPLLARVDTPTNLDAMWRQATNSSYSLENGHETWAETFTILHTPGGTSAASEDGLRLARAYADEMNTWFASHGLTERVI